MVLVRRFGSSVGTVSLNVDSETFLLVCGRGSESMDEKYSAADWPSVIFLNKRERRVLVIFLTPEGICGNVVKSVMPFTRFLVMGSSTTLFLAVLFGASRSGSIYFFFRVSVITTAPIPSFNILIASPVNVL